MGLKQVQGEWVPLQIKVFSRWFAAQLKKNSSIKFNDITKDLKNGVALIELAKILTCKETPRRWIYTPKRNIDMVQNCDLALDMFSKDGVRFIGISGRDINENNEKLILGLAWTIISHYAIGSKNNKDSILCWASDRIKSYPNVENFAPYDLSLCALLDSYVPNKINYESLNPTDSEYNLQLAIDIMEELGIPIFLYPEDLANQESKFDQQIILTQLSAAKTVLENLPPQQIDFETTERSVNLIEEYQSESETELNDESDITQDVKSNEESSAHEALEINNENKFEIEKYDTVKTVKSFDFEDFQDTLIIIMIILTLILLVLFEFSIV